MSHPPKVTPPDELAGCSECGKWCRNQAELFNHKNAKHSALEASQEDNLNELEDLVHLIGDGWLMEAFDLAIKDPKGDGLLELIERVEADIRKEISAHFYSKKLVMDAIGEDEDVSVNYTDVTNNGNRRRNHLRQQIKNRLEGK